jgi:hypothetical protein
MPTSTFRIKLKKSVSRDPTAGAAPRRRLRYCVRVSLFRSGMSLADFGAGSDWRKA